jgi:hypothetical protein
MWRVLIVMSTLVTTCVAADAQLRTPSGCFVTDVERGYFSPMPTCFNEGRLSIVPFSKDDGYSAEDIHLMYGYQYGSLINISNDMFYQWRDAEARAATNLANSNTH